MMTDLSSWKTHGLLFRKKDHFFFVLMLHPQVTVSTWMMESVRGSVMTLSSSGASSPVSMLKDSMMSRVSLYRTPVATSRGRRISTESQLKKSWTVAPAKALKQGDTLLLEHGTRRCGTDTNHCAF